MSTLEEVLTLPEKDFNRQRLYERGLEAVKKQFLNPAFDKQQSTSDLYQFRVEMNRVLAHVPASEREGKEELLHAALKDYAPAAVHFLFHQKDPKAISDIQGRIETLADFFPEDSGMENDVLKATNDLLEGILKKTLEKMAFGQAASAAFHNR